MRMNMFFGALGSDHMGRDDVEINQGRGQSMCSRMFIHVKSPNV